VTGILAYGYIMIEDSSSRSMLGMYRPEVSAQGRRSPSEAMPSPRGSKPCAVRYVHLLYEGRYLSQTSGTGTFCRACLAARAAYSTRVFLTYPPLLRVARAQCTRARLRAGRSRCDRQPVPPRANADAMLLACTEARRRCSGVDAVGYGGELSRLNHGSSGPVQSAAGGKSIDVRVPPCSSSKSYSSLEGRSATLHLEGTNS